MTLNELDKYNKIPKSAINKYFKATIECIKNLFKEYEITLEYEVSGEAGVKSNRFKIKLSKENKKGIPFEIYIPKRLDVNGIYEAEGYGLLKQLELNEKGNSFIVNQNCVRNFKPFYKGHSQTLTGIFSNIYSNNLTRIDCFCRMLLKVNEHDLIQPTSILEFNENYIKYDIETYNQHRSTFGIPVWTTEDMYTVVDINGLSFHFYAIENISSYIIDSTSKLPLNEFISYCNIIRIAFAFITGNYYRDEVFYFTSDDNDFNEITNFEYKFEKKTIITNYTVIKPHVFFSIFDIQTKEIQDLWQSYHKMLSTKVFSDFCEILNNSEQFRRAVELIINGGNELEPIQEGALYSVALETLAEYFSQELEESLKPIPDNKTSKEIISTLLETLEKYEVQIGSEANTILKAKINNINSPTNRDRLIKPFEILNIRLSVEDKLLIDDRNKYLHGNIPKHIKSFGDITGVTIEMRMLLSKLILKHIGYSGHVINLNSYLKLTNPKIRENLQSFDSDKIIELLKAIDAGSLPPEEIENATLQIKKYHEQLKMVIKLIQVVTII